MSRIPTKIYHRLPHRLPPLERYSNYCLGFNGLNNYVGIPNSASLKFAGSHTLTAWIRITTIPTGYVGLIAKRAGTGTWEYSLMLNNDEVATSFSGGTTHQTVGVDLVAGVGYYIACVFDDIANTMKIHVNGIERYSGVELVAPTATNNDVTIGSLGFAAMFFFDGIINEASIIPAILTQRQMLESLYRGYALRELDARLVLRMEEGSGLTAYDESGYGNNGSLLPALTPPVWARVAKYELLAEAGV